MRWNRSLTLPSVTGMSGSQKESNDLEQRTWACVSPWMHHHTISLDECVQSDTIPLFAAWGLPLCEATAPLFESGHMQARGLMTEKGLPTVFKTHSSTLTHILCGASLNSLPWDLPFDLFDMIFFGLIKTNFSLLFSWIFNCAGPGEYTKRSYILGTFVWGES